MKKQTIFSATAPSKVQRSTFNLSHERKMSCNMGELIPVLVQECLPGDKFNIDIQHLIRFSPLVSPVMHRINAYIHFFFVPNRLVFDGWEDLITKGDGTCPTVSLNYNNHVYTEGCLADHMGLPTGNLGNDNDQMINAIPFRGYQLIWNEYYRDQQAMAESDKTDRELIESDLFKRCWQKDYFTSALPYAQYGEPVNVSADIAYKDIAETHAQNSSVDIVDGKFRGYEGEAVDVMNLDGITIDVEDIRFAQRLQRFLEKTARTGRRYVEHLLGHWGVVSPDARLQRPEYLGGGSSPIVISEVLGTTGLIPEPSEEEQLPIGHMAGHGMGIGRTNKAYKYCEEHGYIFAIMSILPETNYQQGIPRHLSRTVQMDYAFPEFAQLGEQEILNKELYYPGKYTLEDAAFGYQSRYAEYKYTPSSIHGEFRTSLEFWHLGRIFDNLPTLGDAFLEANPDTRIFADEGGKTTIYVLLYNKVIATRPLPYFNDPSF